MGNLFQELKRRKVFRVAAVYVVVAWVLIQVADTLFPALQLPDWTITFVTVLFILGFPIALVLAWAYELSSEGVHADTGLGVQTQTAASQNQALVYATFLLVLLVAGFQIADRFWLQQQTDTSISDSRPIEAGLSRRLEINLGETRVAGTHADIAVSPDGSRLVYKVQRPNSGALPQLWFREIDDFESQLIATGLITNPIFSPDGEWLAYIDNINGELYKLNIQSGFSQLLVRDINPFTGGSWHTDDFIYLTDSAGQLLRVSSDGSQIESLSTTGEIPGFYVYPDPLPDSDSLLFTIGPSDPPQIALLNIQTREVRILIDDGFGARYVPTGHIVFMRSSNLWAVPFDLESKEIVGAEVPVAQGVEARSRAQGAEYTFSEEGTLFFVPGEDRTPGARRIEGQAEWLVWVDQSGNEEPIPIGLSSDAQAGSNNHVVSPDGQRLALTLAARGHDIWTFDLESNNRNQLTFDDDAQHPLWNHDGSRIAFYSPHDGGGIWWRAANGTGEAERLVSAFGNVLRPNAFTPDGSHLVYELNGDLFLLTLGLNEPAELLLGTESREARASLSPDGRWIAYESDESGEFRIYVRPFPDVDSGKWQISNTAGIWPKWSTEGSALYYRGVSPNYSTVWKVEWGTPTTSKEFQFETPVQLFEGNYRPEFGRYWGSVFDVSEDGPRFLMIKSSELDASDLLSENTQIRVVENWFEELERLAPRDED